MASFQVSQMILLYWVHTKTAEWNASFKMFFSSQSQRLSEWAAHHSIKFTKWWIILKCHFLLISLSVKAIHPLCHACSVVGVCWHLKLQWVSAIVLFPVALYLLPRSLLASFESPIKFTYFKERTPYCRHDLWIVLLLIFMQSVFMAIPISFTSVMILWFGLWNYNKVFKKNPISDWICWLFPCHHEAFIKLG